MQSEPVSPPPITTTCLPSARIGATLPSGSSAHAPVLLRQELHGEMDAVELAARDRQVARLLGAAGEHDRVVARRRARSTSSSMPTWTLQWKVTPSASICATRRSTWCFSILKSGMP